MSRHELIERNQGRANRTVLLADVVRFEASQKYVEVHTSAGSIVLPDPLKELTAEFAERFYLAHRSHLVDPARIKGIIGHPRSLMLLELDGVPDRVPLSRRSLKGLRKLRPDLAITRTRLS